MVESFTSSSDMTKSNETDNTSYQHLHVFLLFQVWTNWFHVLRFMNIHNIFAVRDESHFSNVLLQKFSFEQVSILSVIKQIINNDELKVKTLVIFEGSPEFIISRFDNFLDLGGSLLHESSL